MKSHTKLKIQKNTINGEEQLVKVKGSNLQNFFELEASFKENQKTQVEQLEFKDFDDCQYCIQQISIYLSESFLQDSLFIQLAQEISSYNKIRNLTFINKSDLQFSESDLENIKNFVKYFKSVNFIQIKLNLEEEKYLILYDIFESIYEFQNLEQLNIENQQYNFIRNSDYSVDCLQTSITSFADSQIFDKLKKYLLYVKKLDLILDYYTFECLQIAIQAINNQKQLNGLYFNYTRSYEDKHFLNLELGGENFKVLDTGLQFNYIYNTIKTSPNLQVLRLIKIIDGSQDYSVLFSLTNLKELMLCFDLTNKNAREIQEIKIKQFQKINNLDLKFNVDNFNLVSSIIEDLEGFSNKTVYFKFTNRKNFEIQYKQSINTQDEYDHYEIEDQSTSLNLSYIQILISCIQKLQNPKDLLQNSQQNSDQQFDCLKSDECSKGYFFQIKLNIKQTDLQKKLLGMGNILSQNEIKQVYQKIFISKNNNYLFWRKDNLHQSKKENKYIFELDLEIDSNLDSQNAEFLIKYIPFNLENYRFSFKHKFQYTQLEQINFILENLSNSKNSNSFQRIYQNNEVQIEWIQEKQSQIQNKQNEFVIHFEDDIILELNQIISLLSSTKYLTIIKIYLNWNNIIKQKQIMNLDNYLENQVCLTKFEYFHFGNFEKQIIFQPLLNVKDIFQQLRELNIQIDSPNVKNKYQEQLGNVIEMCQLLKSFKINIISKDKLEDLNNIIDKLTVLKHLQFITLRFKYSNQKFEHILSMFSKIFENKHFVSFSLQIDKIKSNLDIKNVKNFIKNLNHIKQFRINIQNFSLQYYRSLFIRHMKRLTILDVKQHI